MPPCSSYAPDPHVLGEDHPVNTISTQSGYGRGNPSCAETSAENELLLRLAHARRKLALAKRFGKRGRGTGAAGRDCGDRLVTLGHVGKLAHLFRLETGQP